MRATNTKRPYAPPKFVTRTREQVVELALRRLTELSHSMPEYGDVWHLFYDRLRHGAEPMDIVHLANRYALGACLREACNLHRNSRD